MRGAGSAVRRFSRRGSKRRFLRQLGALAGIAVAGAGVEAGAGPAAGKDPPSRPWDVIVVGAGTAGIPLAIFAARRGARVLLVDAAPRIGGTLFLSSGQMSAAGTRLQKSLGIEDTPQEPFDDVMRISHGTARPDILRLAVDNAAAAADWLMDCGFKPRAGHPVLSGGHDPYTKRRYFWGEHGGLSILEVLQKEIQPEIDRGRVTALLETEVTSLLQSGSGAPVSGVVVKGTDGKSVSHRGRSVVLTCGGYISNPTMFQRFEGVRDYGSTVYPYSRGAGITMGLAAGGYVRGKECHQPLFNGVLAGEAVPSPLLLHLTTDPAVRPAWEIWVNVRGERFVREDTTSFDEREKGLAHQPEERCWVVFDEAILQASPPMSREFTKSEIIDAFGVYPTFYKAASIEGLAAATGIDAGGLGSTIAAYNAAQASGHDVLGRQHMPMPLAQGPYYAIRMQGYYLLDAAGLAVDSRLRVITKGGTPVPNLYAAGELLGMAAFQGQSYCGGMSVMPAIAFGRLLGNSILPIDV
jgi:fumarate reductase flavoprotein subunit